MNGMTAQEFLHATVTADFVHWGVVGVIALAGWLLSQYLTRRRMKASSVPATGVIKQWTGPCPFCRHCCQLYDMPPASPPTLSCALCGADARMGGHLRGAPVCWDCLTKHLANKAD